MQAEIRRALERDRCSAIGFALGCEVAGLFFRRLSLMLVRPGARSAIAAQDANDARRCAR
jgi:hypothetical protein